MFVLSFVLMLHTGSAVARSATNKSYNKYVLDHFSLNEQVLLAERRHEIIYAAQYQFW